MHNRLYVKIFIYTENLTSGDSILGNETGSTSSLTTDEKSESSGSDSITQRSF
nr:hypothetical protein GZ17F1_26 [uncultured archaeon GZfos17F1]